MTAQTVLPETSPVPAAPMTTTAPTVPSDLDDQVRHLLASPESVRRWLEEDCADGETVGWSNMPHGCPLATFLALYTGRMLAVDEETAARDVPLPPWAKAFVLRIDLRPDAGIGESCPVSREEALSILQEVAPDPLK